MNILMVLNGFYPPDNRVKKEIKTLTEAGHSIILLCKKKTSQPSSEQLDSLSIQRVDRSNRLKLWYDHANVILSEKYLFWKHQIERVVEIQRVDAVHVHDLPLVNTAWAVTKKRRIPLVADLHEMYPEAIKKAYGLKPWIRYPYLMARWGIQERKCFENADRVIVVSPEIVDYDREKYHVGDKVSYLMNTVDLDEFNSYPIEPSIIDSYKDYFTLLSSGGGGPHRGLSTAIEALPKIAQAVPTVRLLLVGPNNSAPDSPYIIKTGWQEHSTFPSYIQASKIGIIPVRTNSLQTDFSNPNRIFEYMALGKPVITSNARSLSIIINGSGAGLVFEADNPGAFADAVIKLAQDRDLYERCSRAAREAVQNRYNWKMEGQKLADLYEHLS